MPECSVNLTQTVIYLSLAPKSNAVYQAYSLAKKTAHTSLTEPVPLHLRNAPTGLMKDLGYGKDYVYAHDISEKVSPMGCLPETLTDKVFYKPTEEGLEKRFKERLQYIKNLKKTMKNY